MIVVVTLTIVVEMMVTIYGGYWVSSVGLPSKPLNCTTAPLPPLLFLGWREWHILQLLTGLRLHGCFDPLTTLRLPSLFVLWSGRHLQYSTYNQSPRVGRGLYNLCPLLLVRRFMVTILWTNQQEFSSNISRLSIYFLHSPAL